MTDSDFHVAIVGGGLVGSLAAVYLGQRGWKVTVYELRGDIRKMKLTSGRSINLALSTRGISALESAGIDAGIVETLIPMKGRMIHTVAGGLASQPYGVFGECINSVDRKLMNEHLLNNISKQKNVTVVFEHELLRADLDKKQLVFKRPDGSTVTVTADLILGCDGAYSRLRREMMRLTRMDYSQQYIEHAYVELNMPPDEKGQYKMNANHLHIWPRQTFMMIALPNLDGSFTVTLFMPWSKFDAIKTPEDLLAFFTATFPDSVPLIGKDLLVHDYFKNPKGALMTVKCKPYNYHDKALIIGDAAHAMVPFYGQGMNCGFEDCLVLDTIFDKYFGKRGSKDAKRPTPEAMVAALNEYSATRYPDATAICDLAIKNYVEMRSSVTKMSYKLRKNIEGFLHKIFPRAVIPLYTMVSFTRIPYSEAMRRFNRQTSWFNWAGAAASLGGVVAVGVVGTAMFLRYKKI